MTPLLRPLLLRATMRALPRTARALPGDDPVVRVDGPDPDRVLLVGSGPVSGAGAPSHVQALPGTVARALAARTGHGAVVEALGRRVVRLDDLPAMLRGTRLERFDALVLVVGLFDAAEGAGTRSWSRSLRRRLDAIERDGARDAAVLLTRVPPMSTIAARPGIATALVDREVRRLNRAIDRAAAERSRTGCAVLPPPSPAAPLAAPDWYRACGEVLAEALLPLLEDQRRG